MPDTNSGAPEEWCTRKFSGNFSQFIFIIIISLAHVWGNQRR